MRILAFVNISTIGLVAQDYELTDVHGAARQGTERVRNTFTILNGTLPSRIDAPAPPPWIEPELPPQRQP